MFVPHFVSSRVRDRGWRPVPRRRCHSSICQSTWLAVSGESARNYWQLQPSELATHFEWVTLAAHRCCWNGGDGIRSARGQSQEVFACFGAMAELLIPSDGCEVGFRCGLAGRRLRQVFGVQPVFRPVSVLGRPGWSGVWVKLPEERERCQQFWGRSWNSWFSAARGWVRRVRIRSRLILHSSRSAVGSGNFRRFTIVPTWLFGCAGRGLASDLSFGRCWSIGRFRRCYWCRSRRLDQFT